MVTVMLAWNNKHGNFDGKLRMASFGNDCETLYLEGDIMDGDETILGVNKRDEGCFVLGKKSFMFTGYKSHVGNLCWDSVQMEAGEAARLVNYLRSLPHWCCTCAESGLYSKWNSKEPITAADLERATAT